MPTGFILHPTYRVRDGAPQIQLYGRLDDGRPFLAEDDRFRPYFFARAEDAEVLRADSRAELHPESLVDLEGHPVVRVVATVPAAVPALRERLSRAGHPALEADLRFPYRYLIDHRLGAGVELRGASNLREGLVHFANPQILPAAVKPELAVLSLDLETSPDASEIRSVALVGDGADEVHLVSRRPVDGAAVHPDERALLAAAARRIREIDPDVLVGWNVVDFDLRTWARRGAALRLPLEIGRVPGEIAFQQDARFTLQGRAVVTGRMVLDGMSLVRDALRLEDYRLETAAREVLGRGKLLGDEVADPAAEIDRLYREEPEALVAYNREDARLVRDILEHEGLLALAVERSLLSGMQLDRVGASVASFDLLYLPELRARGVVAPSADAARKSAPVRGGAVLDSKPGLFRDVAVYDFRSLYPSLIRTFGLDPLAHARAGEDALRAPNGARFSREEAILPDIIERFMASRDAAKARGDRHADQAIKIMMNALFGVLGASGCRFFDPEVANAITGFGQTLLHWTRDAFEQEGVDVLYGDTDSVFVQLHGHEDDARREARELRDRVQACVAKRVRDDYGAEPRLDLELERVYARFFMPRVRSGASGSKKRYAGLWNGELVVVGLESVRRDWPAVTRRLQRGLLERVFHDRPLLPFVRDLVRDLRAGALDAELVYAKRVRKGSLDRYTGPAPPHVQAARKAGAAAGPVVRYVIGAEGPEPVFHGRPLPADIDRSHYVERVVRPVAQAILAPLGEHLEDALGEPRQLGLL